MKSGAPECCNTRALIKNQRFSVLLWVQVRIAGQRYVVVYGFIFLDNYARI